MNQGFFITPLSRKIEVIGLHLQPLKACFQSRGNALKRKPERLAAREKEEVAVTKDCLIKALKLSIA